MFEGNVVGDLTVWTTVSFVVGTDVCSPNLTEFVEQVRKLRVGNANAKRTVAKYNLKRPLTS